MKKDLGVKPYVFPMPVLMIATYDEEEKVDVMNMAWGGICDDNMIALNISEEHQTADNIKKRMAFTLSIADIDHLAESDYFGTVSGRNVEDKFERTGMHAVKSAGVDAPIILDYPLTLECKVVELEHTANGGFRVLGEILNVIVDSKVLDENGNVDPTKLNAFVFDQFQNGYYKIGEKVGDAWKSGRKFIKKTK